MQMPRICSALTTELGVTSFQNGRIAHAFMHTVIAT
jgi:hypothetical protein